ncbi:DUF4253 domain-containing protein [Flavobacterium psychrotrophum]|uniref:DUF4253 domain-containing protein n=1 Tax=Flavobacterium psychrotrophum TaxID=2294119 RepID=UPI000E31061C|nr:DUF4253 domain-containing protein [Flavobacterium psychrotrophum]
MKTTIYCAVLAFVFLSCEKRKDGPVLSVEETALNEKVHFNPAVLLKLREYTDAQVKQFITVTHEYDAERHQDMTATNYNHALVVGLPPNEATAISGKMDAWLRQKGYILFKSYDGFGHGSDSLTILKTKDQFDILRAVGTEAVNYNHTTNAIIGTLYRWHTKYPFTIKGAGPDWIEAQFIKQPADMTAFAKELYAFCPDIVDQGSGSVDEMAKEMKDNNILYLWWD